MKQSVKWFLTIFCVSLVLCTGSACHSKKETIENPPPPLPEKDEWIKYSDDEKLIGNNQWSFVIDNKVYFGSEEDDLQIYDIVAKKWAGSFNYPPGFETRTGCSVAVLNKKAYIGGGRVGGVKLLDWWEFDPLAVNPWRRLKDCPMQQYGGLAFIWRDELYTGLSMGFDAGKPVQNRFYRYDIARDRWNPDPFIINTASGTNGFGFFLKDHFYFGAGFDQLNDDVLLTKKCHRFTPGAGTSNPIADFPVTLIAAENAITFQANEKGYVLLSGSALFCYDPVTNKWTQLKDTPDEGGRHFLQYVHRIGEKVYGFTQSGRVHEYIYR